MVEQSTPLSLKTMQDEQGTRGNVGCVCVCPILYPLVFKAGSHGVKLAEPPLVSNEVVTPAWLRRWGPQARSADQVGRSACSRLQLPPTSSYGLSWASSCLNAGACLVLTEFELVLGLPCQMSFMVMKLSSHPIKLHHSLFLPRQQN